MINSFIKKFTGNKKSSSYEAKKRLKFALVYDSLEASSETLDDLKKDIIDVISKYFEIDNNDIQLDIDRSNEYSSLVLNTPILSVLRK